MISTTKIVSTIPYFAHLQRWNSIFSLVQSALANQKNESKETFVSLFHDMLLQDTDPLCQQYQGICRNCIMGKLSPCKKPGSAHSILMQALGTLTRHSLQSWAHKNFLQKYSIARELMSDGR